MKVAASKKIGRIWGSFRGKLLLLVLLSLFPALALALQRNLSLRRAEKARLTDSVTATANLIAAHESGFVKNARQILATLADLSFLVRTSNELFTAQHFENLLKLSPDYLNFGLIELDGTLFASAVKPPGGKASLADRSYFQRAVRTRRFSVGDFQLGRLTGEPGVNFGHPVLSGGGAVERVLFASLKLSVLADAARHVPLPAGGSVLIIDAAGTVLARVPEMPGLVGRPLKENPLVGGILARRQGSIEGIGLDGETRYFGIAPVLAGDEPAFFVAVGVPSELLFANANRALARSLLFLAGIAAAVLALAFAFANRALIRPVKDLAAAATQLAAANWGVRAGTRHGASELNRLAENFNAMAASLERRDRELQEAQASIQTLNADLEERVRERTAQLTAANLELESFSYSVSHDLRAPLRHLDGFAQLLQKHQMERLDERGRRHLEIIGQAARKMGLLIDELLTFSRMGRKELLAESVPMARLVNEVVTQVKAEAPGRAIDWVIGELPEVHGDAAMLRQVWLNLVSNAVKYSGRKESARIEIGSIATEKEYHFFVKDNGAGFDMRFQDKLFGVFQRLHSDAEFEGVGIGLANVRRIVTRHGGRTWAQGEPGLGATFYFSLPL